MATKLGNVVAYDKRESSIMADDNLTKFCILVAYNKGISPIMSCTSLTT